MCVAPASARCRPQHLAASVLSCGVSSLITELRGAWADVLTATKGDAAGNGASHGFAVQCSSRHLAAVLRDAANGIERDDAAAVFADIAARRKELNGKRGALPGPAPRPKTGRAGDREVMAGMLKAALAVLSDPDVPGSEKRSALTPIVERVICRKGGADVVFAPGLLDES